MAQSAEQQSAEMQSPLVSKGFPEVNPIDRYRIAAAEQISRITGAHFGMVFDSLDRSSHLDHGDLGLALPRIRIKNTHPEELGKQIMAEVCS
jgi:arginyl-tRNA synthetase